jgi:hypothetical protein
MTETETKWSERVRDWRAGGKSAEEFSEGQGFKASTLRFWASQLRRKTPADKERPAPVPAVRIARVVRRHADPSMEIAVGRARIVVRAGFDAGLLRKVIDALGGEQ